jgi:Na+/melibiose symporter-like transporter
VTVQQRVQVVWKLPGTRLGFWVHFAAMSAPVTLAVLWGQPYLVKGAGFSPSAASTVLLFSVIVSAIASPIIGASISRKPALRVPLVVTVCVMTILGWSLLLLAGGNAPAQPGVIALFGFTALGSPASAIGFSLARDYNRVEHLGTASGVVNVGGFTATVVGALGVGWVLDAAGVSDGHSFRLALIVIVGVQAVGVVQMMRWWHKLRIHLLDRVERGEPIPVSIVRHRWDRRLSRT